MGEELSTEDLERQLVERKQREMDERYQKCNAALNAVLAEHGFALDAVITFSAAGVDRKVLLIPRKE